METQKIQATITLTLTQEQLLTLLNAAPAQVQTTAPTPAPTPAPAPAPAPAQMFAQPVAAPMPQAQPMAQPVAVPMQTPTPMQTPAPMPQAQPTPAPMPTQTAPQTYSVTDLGLAARPLMENGRQQELIALLAEFGVQSVAAIPENRRADFAARLRALGGQI
jgi:hypothetical protein